MRQTLERHVQFSGDLAAVEQRIQVVVRGKWPWTEVRGQCRREANTRMRGLDFVVGNGRSLSDNDDS